MAVAKAGARGRGNKMMDFVKAFDADKMRENIEKLTAAKDAHDASADRARTASAALVKLDREVAARESALAKETTAFNAACRERTGMLDVREDALTKRFTQLETSAAATDAKHQAVRAELREISELQLQTGANQSKTGAALASREKVVAAREAKASDTERKISAIEAAIQSYRG